MSEQLNLSNYRQRKKEKRVKLIRIEDQCFVVINQYDPETGLQLKDKTVKVNIDELKKLAKSLKSNLEEIVELIADLKELPNILT